MYNKLVYYTVASVLFFLLSLLFLKTPVYAGDVVINEFSSASNPEWVELYNTSSTEVSLDGWTVLFQDNPDTNQKVVFGASDTIPPGGHKVFERTYTGTQAWLSNSGDTIFLKDQSFSEKDRVGYGNASGSVVGVPSDTQSGGRFSDGSSSWLIFDQPTKGEANTAPIVTLTPTSTSSPTNTPTSTKIPTSTPTKVVTPTPSPTKSLISPTIEESPSAGEAGLVLAENIASESPTPTPQIITAGFAETNLAKILIILGGLFLTSCGIVFAKWRKEISN